MTPATFSTDSPDLAAFLVTVTGEEPEIRHPLHKTLAELVFPRTPEVLAAVADFATGSAVAPAKQLLAARRRLFHRLRNGGAQ